MCKPCANYAFQRSWELARYTRREAEGWAPSLLEARGCSLVLCLRPFERSVRGKSERMSRVAMQNTASFKNQAA